MDALTFFVASANLKLRLEYLRRHPELLEERMAIPNFEGLTDAFEKLEFELEHEAGKLHADIAQAKDRGMAAVGKSRERLQKIRDGVQRVEQFAAKLEGSNGGNPLQDSSQSSNDSGSPQPEHLTVNGVSQS